MQETCSKAIYIDFGGMTRWGRWIIHLGPMWKVGLWQNYEPQAVYQSPKVTASCRGTSKYRLTTRLNTSPRLWYWIKQNARAWLLMLLVLWHASERQRERENWELPRPEAGVETDLEIVQGNCGANHNWCIRNCFERSKKWLAEIGVTSRLESLQRAFLLGTARILRKVLDT